MEGVSTPFGYTMDLLSENAAIAPPDVLRKPACVTIKTPDGGDRIVHGLIRSFTQLGQSDGLLPIGPSWCPGSGFCLSRAIARSSRT